MHSNFHIYEDNFRHNCPYVKESAMMTNVSCVSISMVYWCEAGIRCLALKLIVFEAQLHRHKDTNCQTELVVVQPSGSNH